MKSILIIGSYYSFTRKLINKLYIEKWRIYTLVKYKEKSSQRYLSSMYLIIAATV